MSQLSPLRPHKPASSSLPRLIENNAPSKAHNGYYHIRDLKNEKNIAMGKIEAVTPGTMVHAGKMETLEVKLSVCSVYPGMLNELVHLDQQGGNTIIAEFEGSYIAWPVYLLKEIM